MKSKFEFKDNRPFSVKAKDFMQSLLFWKGRKKGIIYTRDIKWDDIREIFFPKNFSEKYSYLGSVPYNPKSDTFVALLPLVLAMDYEAKPKWCPRWVLRFLYVFGDDKSIVRVRNRFLSNLSNNLTKGITLYDYKTKWSYYDLRISIAGPQYLQDLADDIERGYYNRGKRQELISTIRGYDPSFNRTYITVGELQEYLDQISGSE
ncbi:hypothetical protein EBU71_09735 [bacterium]|nr:hypothetical protein [Candidatus Elulimicrobium humile]